MPTQETSRPSSVVEIHLIGTRKDVVEWRALHPDQETYIVSVLEEKDKADPKLSQFQLQKLKGLSELRILVSNN